MENSTNSMSKARPNNHSETIRKIDQSPEESSWTMYFEDFLQQNNNEYDNSPISSDYESSLISDAGSSANAKKFVDDEEIDRCGMNTNRSTCNRSLSLKKRKTVEVLLDEALEDTASSPVNSPKVFNLSPLGVKPKKNDDVIITNMFEDKLGSTSEQMDERRKEQLGYNNIGKESDRRELKKRGLCLFPLSMLVNYLG